MPKIEIAGVAVEGGAEYPENFRSVVAGLERRRLGDAVGISQFGVNLTRLRPGSQSALRHWHEAEDEFVYVLEGTVVLHEDHGETLLKAGDAAGFKAGVGNGHCIVNRSTRDALLLEIGTRAKRERAHYPDVDLVFEEDESGWRHTHKSGEPY